MSHVIWTFKTLNFRIVCEEEGARFIDPLLHEEAIVDAVEIRLCEVTHLSARVYWRENEVGRASMRDRIYEFENDGHTIVADRSYLFDVVRKALSDARRALAEMQSDLPDVYLRPPVGP